MQRSTSANAIVLFLRPLGENNSLVRLLTEESGVVDAVLYGGPKSRLRSLVTQWNSGTAWLYENPEKHQVKISDFEPKNYHSSFGQNLFKMYAASLAAEIAIKTKCAGSHTECFALVSGFLDGMELCDEEQARVGLLRFLWRYIGLLGIQGETACCGRCGRSFSGEAFASHEETYYNSTENIFICPECARADPPGGTAALAVKVAAVRYLHAVSVLSPAEARKTGIDRNGCDQIKKLLFTILENSIDQKLNSIETGRGIL